MAFCALLRAPMRFLYLALACALIQLAFTLTRMVVRCMLFSTRGYQRDSRGILREYQGYTTGGTRGIPGGYQGNLKGIQRKLERVQRGYEGGTSGYHGYTRGYEGNPRGYQGGTRGEAYTYIDQTKSIILCHGYIPLANNHNNHLPISASSSRDRCTVSLRAPVTSVMI